MITSNISNYKKYILNNSFKIGFEYLTKENLEDLPYGKHNINENISIIKETYDTLYLGETFWEAHEKFIDIQFILNGEEKIAYSPINILNEIVYNNKNDLKILKGEVKSFIHLKNNDFAIFFPEDAHMSGLSPEEIRVAVEKVIIKIKI